MPEPPDVLDRALAKAQQLETTVVANSEIAERIEYICRCPTRAGVRLVMACMLATLVDPSRDPRKPYTQIGGGDSFSGRHFDETYISALVIDNKLPCNTTTAFLTPAYRNINHPLTPDINYEGRPPRLYTEVATLLDDVYRKRIGAFDAFVEILRTLLIIRDENAARIKESLERQKAKGALPLSSEQVITLLRQHFACPRSSRLPVLAVAAAYDAASERLGERARKLQSHNAADLQTGAVGDVEICLVNEDQVVTIYEMKDKRVTVEDLNIALGKLDDLEERVDNYIFITTDVIDPEVSEYASQLYEQTGGTEIVVLDCVSFVRHFLHLFHRLRMEFLEAYQGLLLLEPDSAVKQELKEAFLALRAATESAS